MTSRRLSIATFVGLGLLVAVLLVVFVAPRASSKPDGLEKVAADKGIDQDVLPHATADSPLADYGVQGVEHAAAGTAIAGIVGIALTFGLVAAVLWLVRRRRPPADPAAG